jgi:uncharacterized protein
MRIDLTQLGPEGIRVAEAFDAEDLAGGEGSVREALWRPVRVELEAWVRPERHHVRASGSYRADAQAECDRCLKPVAVRVGGDFDLSYRWSEGAGTRGGRDEHELREEDLDVDELEGAVLDTRDVAREQVELAAPIQTLCAEACAGLCPACGADLNLAPCDCADREIDPRWDALRKIKMTDDG